MVILLSSVFITGCITKPPSMYEYGNYSESYYAMKKDSGETTQAEWKIALEEIITKSKEKSLRVPPGVYANLGYIHLKINNIDNAISYFKEEKLVYPESTKLMDTLINKANGGE